MILSFFKKYVVFARLYYAPIIIGFLCTPMLVVFNRFMFNPSFIVSIVSVFLMVTSLIMINCIFDCEDDKVAHPERPLPSGYLSIEEAWVYLWITIGLMIITAYFVNVEFVLAELAMIAFYFFVCWSKHQKIQIPGFALFCGAFYSALVPLLFGYFVFQKVNLPLIIFSFGFFFIELSHDNLLSIADKEGDIRGGVKTLVPWLGETRVAVLAIFSIMVGYSFTIFHWFINQNVLFPYSYLPVAIFMGPFVMYRIFIFLYFKKKDDVISAHKANELYNLLYAGMIWLGIIPTAYFL